MARKPITRKEFADLAKGNDPSATASLLRKSLDTEIRQDGDGGDPHAGGVLSFVISSDVIDREGDTIDPKGWELANFIKSGTVLANHDTSKPIARPFDTHIDGDALKSKAEFPDSDTHEFGNLQYRLLLAGILRATSVGFKPLEWAFNEERPSQSWMGAIDFKRQELLEFSVVSVPANPDALVEARSKGFDLAPLCRWAEQMLDETPAGLSVTREQLESLRKELAPTSATVPNAEANHRDTEHGDPPDTPHAGGLAKLLADLVTVASTVADGTSDGETLTDANAERMKQAAGLISDTLDSLNAGQAEPDPEVDLAEIVDRAVAASLNTPDAIVQRALAKDAAAMDRDLRRTRGALP